MRVAWRSLLVCVLGCIGVGLALVALALALAAGSPGGESAVVRVTTG
jgi:hypothetical protein